MKHLVKNGSITLTTVLVVGAILLASGVSLILTTIDLGSASKNYFNANLANIRSTTCLEEGFYKLRKDTTFTGNINFSYSDGNCSVSIQNDAQNSQTKILSISSTLSSYNSTRTVRVDTSANPFSIIK
jgi:hypothetical protein